MVMVFLLMELGRSLYFDRAEWRHVFLLFAIGMLQFLEASYYRPPQFRNEILKSWLVVVVTLPLLKSYIHLFLVAVFSCWRHMHRQFLMMSLPRPEAVVMDVESVMRELLVRDSSNQSTIVKDSPPKYEDLETVPCDEPPQYDERTMNTPANNCDTNRPVQNLV